jgi:hypothetical protein
MFRSATCDECEDNHTNQCVSSDGLQPRRMLQCVFGPLNPEPLNSGVIPTRFFELVLQQLKWGRPTQMGTTNSNGDGQPLAPISHPSSPPHFSSFPIGLPVFLKTKPMGNDSYFETCAFKKNNPPLDPSMNTGLVPNGQSWFSVLSNIILIFLFCLPPCFLHF